MPILWFMVIIILQYHNCTRDNNIPVLIILAWITQKHNMLKQRCSKISSIPIYLQKSDQYDKKNNPTYLFKLYIIDDYKKMPSQYT